MSASRRRSRIAAALLVVVAAAGSACTPLPPVTTPGATETSPNSPSNPSTSVPTPEPEPTSIDIPESALLQLDDVGAGFAIFDDARGGDHGSIAMLMSYCGQTEYSPALTQRLAERNRSLTQRGVMYAYEEVTRYGPTWATRHLSDLQRVLPRCPSVAIMGDERQRATLSLVATNFTGDESLLIRQTLGTETQYHVLVRQGDVEARLRMPIGDDEQAARTVAARAAERLCQTTPTC